MVKQSVITLTISVIAFPPRIKYGVSFFRGNDGRDILQLRNSYQDLSDYQIPRIERALPANGSNPDNPQILKILIQTIPVAIALQFRWSNSLVIPAKAGVTDYQPNHLKRNATSRR